MSNKNIDRNETKPDINKKIASAISSSFVIVDFRNFVKCFLMTLIHFRKYLNLPK